MECMCAQARPWFILSSERVLGNGERTHVNSKGEIPSTGGYEEGTNAVSRRTASPSLPIELFQHQECSSWHVEVESLHTLVIHLAVQQGAVQRGMI